MLFDTLDTLLDHAGIASPKQILAFSDGGLLLINGCRSISQDHVKPGDRILLPPGEFIVIKGGSGRLQLNGIEEFTPKKIAGRVRVHAGYHKCLTEYCKSVYRKTCRSVWFGKTASFKHYYHRLDAFYQDCHRHTITSVSGQSIDLDRFDDIRVVRFIRDPRDLLVSGYFYHKRSAEHWCDLVDPVDLDWLVVNGAVPQRLPHGNSLSGYLNQASMEEGLLAELEFRHHHFESMKHWPVSDERIRLFRYEDILGNEAEVFREILGFYELPWLACYNGVRYARLFSAAQKSGKAGHIRNASSGQWREYFSPGLRKTFNDQYGDLLLHLGYPLE